MYVNILEYQCYFITRFSFFFLPRYIYNYCIRVSEIKVRLLSYTNETKAELSEPEQGIFFPGNRRSKQSQLNGHATKARPLARRAAGRRSITAALPAYKPAEINARLNEPGNEREREREGKNETKKKERNYRVCMQ